MLLSSPAMAAPLPQSIPVDVVSVYDGDTITVNARIWVGQTIRTKVRIDGIDTPEIRGKCASEKRRAKQARDYLKTLLRNGPVTISNVQNGKYAGRVVAHVFANGRNVTRDLIGAGHARSYEGGKRKSWCDQENG